MSAAVKALRQRIAEQARHRCGYCLTLEIVSGIPLTLEHLIPKARGGQDEKPTCGYPVVYAMKPREF